MKTLRAIEAEVAELAARLGARKSELPHYGASRDLGYPHVEVHDQQYHYVVIERGQEIERRSSSNYDDLLYWIFRDVTRSLAFAYELKHRVEDQDCRRIAFPKQIELMYSVRPDLAERLKAHLSDVLKSAPYDDEPTAVVNRLRDGHAT